MALSPDVMDALLGAIRDPRGKPNADQIEQALQQLAIAAAAICRVLPQGARHRFIEMFSMEVEREVVHLEPE
jgi:hypothetical protein